MWLGDQGHLWKNYCKYTSILTGPDNFLPLILISSIEIKVLITCYMNVTSLAICSANLTDPPLVSVLISSSFTVVQDHNITFQ